MHLQSVHCVILSLLPEEQVYMFIVSFSYSWFWKCFLWFSKQFLFPGFLGVIKLIWNYVVAGVMALCATSSYYDMTEIATRILPNIVVLIIDPDRLCYFWSVYLLLPFYYYPSVYMKNVLFCLLNSDVRSKAFQAVDQFLQIVRQYNEKVSFKMLFPLPLLFHWI